MTNPLTWLSRRRYRYEPLIRVEISRSRLLHNLNEFRKLAPHHAVAPVLKSNAYGHGLFEVARILEHETVIPFFVVDSYFEALALRSDGIRKPILIVGYTRPETMESGRLGNVAYTIGSLEALQAIENIEGPIAIHLKIDTGMRRQGILPEEIDRAIELIAENTYIKLTGLISHLSDADNPDPSFTEAQVNVWNRVVHKFSSVFASLKYIHLSATDGHRYSGSINANVSRLGLGLYGLLDGATFNPPLDLGPVMRMSTIVTGVKDLKRDESIGYGATYKAVRDMKVATIPVGYYEGLDRRLSSVGTVGVTAEEIPCRIVGRISMNIASIDVTHVENVRIGTPVVVVSNDPHHENSLVRMAAACGTIPYELAVHVPAHLKRVIVD